MLLPSLTRQQEQRVGDVLHRIGSVPHSVLLPLFLDVDRAGVQATDPVHPSADTAQTLAEHLAGQHHVPPVVVAFSLGLALGLRDGIRFGVARRFDKQRRRIDDDYYRLDEADRAEIRRLIRLLRHGGSLAILTSEAPRATVDAMSADEEAGVAQQWTRRMGHAARQLR